MKNSDALRRQLEAELRDVTARLEEAESVAQKEGKRLVAKLQAKVSTQRAEQLSCRHRW